MPFVSFQAKNPLTLEQKRSFDHEAYGEAIAQVLSEQHLEDTQRALSNKAATKTVTADHCTYGRRIPRTRVPQQTQASRPTLPTRHPTTPRRLLRRRLGGPTLPIGLRLHTRTRVDLVGLKTSAAQPVVALSTCESELMAATEAAKEAVHLRRLHAKLTFENNPPPTHLHLDNMGAIDTAYNHSHHSRMKHCDRKVF